MKLRMYHQHQISGQDKVIRELGKWKDKIECDSVRKMFIPFEIVSLERISLPFNNVTASVLTLQAFCTSKILFPIVVIRPRGEN